MNAGRPTEGWNQIMTLPRLLTLLPNDELGQEPAGDIESLRYNAKHIEALNIPANQEIVLKGITGNSMEISAEIDFKNSELIELNVLRSPNKEEYTRIILYKDKGFPKGREYGPLAGAPNRGRASLVSIESSYSSILPDVLLRAPETAPFVLAKGETVKLRVFIDKSVVEVFVNGQQCVAMRIYPGLSNSTGVSIRSQGQEATLKSLDA